MDGLKLLFVFLLIMVLLWRRMPLGPAMLGGSVLLAVFYRTTPPAFFGMVWNATKSSATIELEIVLALIMILEHLLNQHGYLERMLKGLQSFFRDRRTVMALLPAFIGLMPSAGGALFSAPIVEQAAAGTSITAEEKSFVNYYFRHIWEFVLPFYPGILLASRISGISLPYLIAATAPYGLLTIFLGIPSLLRISPVKEKSDVLFDRWKIARELLLSILPLLVVVFLVLAIQLEVGLAVGLVLLTLLAYYRYTPLKLWHLCRRAIVVKTLLLVWGVMVFKQVLVDTHAVDGLPPLLARLPVPEFMVFGMISFFLGMLTGLTPAYVGITFPIAIAAAGGVTLPLAAFINVAGFAGHMLTPMHLCMVLTVDFFKADLQKIIRMLVPPCATLLITLVIVTYFVLAM